MPGSDETTVKQWELIAGERGTEEMSVHVCCRIGPRNHLHRIRISQLKYR